jgi:hypothetical protein
VKWCSMVCSAFCGPLWSKEEALLGLTLSCSGEAGKVPTETSIVGAAEVREISQEENDIHSPCYEDGHSHKDSFFLGGSEGNPGG